MSKQDRSRRRVGVEERTDARGRTEYRGWVWDPAAERKRRGEWSHSFAQAKGWRTDSLAAMRAGTMAAADGPTVRAAALGWIDRAERGEIRNRSGDIFKPSVLRGYRRDIERRLLPELGASLLAEVRLGDLQRLVDRWGIEGMSPSSVRNALMPLRGIYRYHAARDGLTANPTRGLQLPAVRGTRERVATPAEAAALIAALPAADRAIWAAAFYAGLRRGELRALPWHEVNLASGIIRVRHGWDDLEGQISPKSLAGERVVPVNGRLRELLAEHGMDSRRSAGLVFGRSAAEPFAVSTVRRRALKAWGWKQTRDAGGKRVWIKAHADALEPISLHEARHTFASLMVASGCNAKELQTYMGHASIAITLDRYAHLFPGAEAAAASRLDAYLDGAEG